MPVRTRPRPTRRVSLPSLPFLLSFGPALLLAWPCLYATMVLHELGHAAMHRALGGRVRELHLGGVRWALTSWLRVGLKPWTGRVLYESEPELSRRRRALVTLAGPLANLATGALAAVFAHVGLWAYEWAWVSFVAGALNLLPVLRFDGRRLLSHWWAYRGLSHARRAELHRQVELVTVLALGATLALVAATLA